MQGSVLSHAVQVRMLSHAAEVGDAVTVATLLSSAGVLSFINYQEETSGATPLHLAAANAHAVVTEQLIAARCDVNVQEKNGLMTPLHNATAYGHEAITKQLIAARCNVDLQMNDGNTPLGIAAAIGHPFWKRTKRKKQLLPPAHRRNRRRKRQEVKVQRAPVRRRQACVAACRSG
jgi:ankyrin repeat protein